MKLIFYRKIGLIILIFISMTDLIGQTQSDLWSQGKAARWFKSRDWLKGLRLNPHKSINQREFARQYHAQQEKWDKAFTFLRETDLADLKPGKYPIDGENVFATVTEAPSKSFAVSEWESHRKYQDIQLVIKGKEKIGTVPISKLKVRDVYSETKDVTFYNGSGRYYLAEPGTFFIFFPEDAHRPNIKVDGYDVVKKIVVKVSTGK